MSSNTTVEFLTAMAAEFGGIAWSSPRTSIAVAVLAISLTSLLAKLITKPRLKVRILLSDSIRSSRARALEYCYRPRQLMWRGYQQYPDETYGINTRDGVKVVIPPRFLDDLKSHPALSFKASINNDMQTEFTQFGAPPEWVIHAIRASMTGSLRSPLSIPFNEGLLTCPKSCTHTSFASKSQEEYASNSRHAQGFVQSQIGPLFVNTTYTHYSSVDWTKMKMHDDILHIVGHNNARVFLSTEASLNDEWVKYSTGYVLSTFDCIRKLKEWHPLLRPIVFRFLGERKDIQKQWDIARKYVTSSVQARSQNGANLEDPPSMLDFLSSGKNSHLANDIDEQLLYQMTLIAVGTVTTHASIVQAVYDLATYPEYIPILLEEIESVPRGSDGCFTKESLMAMKKMDSFMKESQRLTAGDLSTFQRGAIDSLTLPDGMFIPQGTKMEVNTCSIHVDEQHYPDPQKFDGLRYYRQRLQPGQENKHLYYSVGKNDLSFGYGRHACPGRYLGQVNIKLVLAELLTRYDLKSTVATGRPGSIEFEALISPDPDFEVFLKSR